MFKDRIKIKARRLYVGGRCDCDGKPHPNAAYSTCFLADDIHSALTQLTTWVAFHLTQPRPMRCKVVLENASEAVVRLMTMDDVLIGHFIVKKV